MHHSTPSQVLKAHHKYIKRDMFIVTCTDISVTPSIYLCLVSLTCSLRTDLEIIARYCLSNYTALLNVFFMHKVVQSEFGLSNVHNLSLSRLCFTCRSALFIKTPLDMSYVMIDEGCYRTLVNYFQITLQCTEASTQDVEPH